MTAGRQEKDSHQNIYKITTDKTSLQEKEDSQESHNI